MSANVAASVMSRSAGYGPAGHHPHPAVPPRATATACLHRMVDQVGLDARVHPQTDWAGTFSFSPYALAVREVDHHGLLGLIAVAVFLLPLSR